MTPARRLLAFAQSQEQNIDDLIQAACKHLFTPDAHGEIIPAKGQEESVRRLSTYK